MNAKDIIRNVIEVSDMVTRSYVEDLTDENLLVRVVPNANHIAWQLGHIITSEQDMLTQLGHTPATLPSGFIEAHSPEASSSDKAANFRGKDEYLSLLDEMKKTVLVAVDATPEQDFDKPAPEAMRNYAPTVGAALAILGTHRLMHAGQFVPIRRKLGLKPLF